MSEAVNLSEEEVVYLCDGDGFPEAFFDDLMACVRLLGDHIGEHPDSLPADLGLVYERALNWLTLRRALVAADLNQTQREAVLAAYAEERGGDSVSLDRLLARRTTSAETKRRNKKESKEYWDGLWQKLRPSYGETPLKGTERTKVFEAMLKHAKDLDPKLRMSVQALRTMLRVKDGYV